ncbi:MAG: hypothetical protein IKE75_05975 [Bacilli bacterium]|nr:hypothetical protein [Bacilli bacterium]
MEEKIKNVVNNVKEEISIVKEVDGLCYYASKKITDDLKENGVECDICNINEYADVDYDHYFVLAYPREDVYLIDITYSQFAKKNAKLRFFKKWPSELLEKNNNELLQNLLSDGYAEINDSDLYDYLGSFNESFMPVFTLDDLKER